MEVKYKELVVPQTTAIGNIVSISHMHCHAVYGRCKGIACHNCLYHYSNYKAFKEWYKSGGSEIKIVKEGK